MHRVDALLYVLGRLLVAIELRSNLDAGLVQFLHGHDEVEVRISFAPCPCFCTCVYKSPIIAHELVPLRSELVEVLGEGVEPI